MPVLVGVVIDRGLVERDVAALVLWLCVLFGLFLVLANSYRVGSLFALRGVEEAGHALRMRVTDRILEARGFGDRDRAVGELLGIGGTDVRIVASGALLFVFPVAELGAIVAAGCVLFGISWPLGLAVLAGGPVFLLVLDRLSGTLRSRVEAEQRVTADSATLAADAIAGYRTLSALGATRLATERYRAASDRARLAALSSRRSESLFVATTSAGSGLFVVAIGLIAAWLALEGAITVGQLVTVVGVAQVVLAPLRALSTNVGAVWARSSASAKRVLSVLQAPTAREPLAVAAGGSDGSDGSDVEADALRETSEGLRVSDLAGDHLDGVGFAVVPGEIVGVVAEHRAAAELVSLLGGRQHPIRGSVRAGDADLASVDGARIHEFVTAAPHTAHVLEGTVADNLVPAPRNEDRTAAALTAGVFEDVLETLPSGVGTRLGAAGRSLSGGQRQRLVLARAYAAAAPVLVLHDPTSSLDAVTELEIAWRLRDAIGNRAAVVVCTSPQLLAQADRVLLLSGGKVVAQGTHAELLRDRPDYAGAIL